MIFGKMTEHFSYFFVVICLFHCGTASRCKKQSLSARTLQRSVDNLIGKKQNVLRPNATGGPIRVEISIHFVRLDEIKTIEESYTSDIFLRMIWNDTRLCHNETEQIIMEGVSSNKFWAPDIFFVNALSTKKHESKYVRISSKGEMLSSTRVTVVARCSQDLTYFPIDTQNCQLIIESYSYTTDHLLIKWSKTSPVSFDSKKMAQFKIAKVGISSGSNTYSTGVFDQISVDIKLERRIGYYIIQVFLPCFIVVSLSWLTFWMSPENIGDRTALGISSVLTNVFLMSSINVGLPKVSYAKAIDFYLIGCFLYVFSVVIETVIAHHLYKKSLAAATTDQSPETSRGKWWKKRMKHRLKRKRYAFQEANQASEKGSVKIAMPVDRKTKKRNTSGGIDYYCRVLFPVVFALLNIIYWVYCTHMNNSNSTK